MSRRDGAIVAWHEVPGTAPPQKSRPVGYGVIRAGVRTDSIIGNDEIALASLRPCPSPCNPAYEIGRCEGRSIDKGRIIGLDSSNLSKPPKLCLATRLWRIQRWYLAGTVHYIEQQVEHHRTRTFQEEYLAFLKKHGAHFDEKYLWH